jgi:hypothetical protein
VRSTSTVTKKEKEKMKTTELYDSRVPTIKTQGLNFHAFGFCELRVDAGFEPEDPDHSRGYVRLELDRESEQCGGIATHVLRASAVREGKLKDVLELHTRGDCETAALARALIFAGTQILTAIDADYAREDTTPAKDGVLHDSPVRSVWEEK